MKNFTLFFTAILMVISFDCFAQRHERGPAPEKMWTISLSDSLSNAGLTIVSYHVVEKINMTFGSRETTYNVPSLNMIRMTDLGANNSRIITPKYGKIKVNAILANTKQQMLPVAQMIVPIAEPIQIVIPAKSDRLKYVDIDILSTYERVLDKGYKSVDMLKRVGNGRFFDGDLEMAAKWYAELFNLTSDLDAEYYYRYAQSLKSISQIKKANEMMEIFRNKSL